jgi:hypothetical protein
MFAVDNSLAWLLNSLNDDGLSVWRRALSGESE